MSYQRVIAIIGIVFASTAIGAGFEDQGYKAIMEKHNVKLTTLVGKTFWIYFDRPDCRYRAPRLMPQPSTRSASYYSASEPVKITVKAIIEPSTEVSKFYQVAINDNETAFEHADTSSLLDVPSDVTDRAVQKNCILPISPEEAKVRIETLEAKAAELVEKQKAALATRRAAEDARIAEEEVRRKKPGVKIGMSKKQVIEKTSWGEPERINRTTTTHGEREQWVYDGGSYLYFTNGKLTAVQN